MKVITLVAIMHENKEISILYTQSVLTDCLNSCYLMRAECLLYINVSFSTHTQPNYYLSFVICYFDPNVFMPCMYISLTLCYIRYISITRTKVLNSKGNFCLFSFYSNLYSLQLVVCI